MKENIEVDLDDPDKCGIRVSKKAGEKIEIFTQEVAMISRLKRMILRKNLKKEKIALLAQVMEINKKLKILNEIDDKAKKENKMIKTEQNNNQNNQGLEGSG